MQRRRGEQIEVAGVVVVQMRDRPHPSPWRRRSPSMRSASVGQPDVIAPALRRHRGGKAGVDHDLAPGAADQPDEVVERHRPVVRIAADEVLRLAPRVVRVLERVDLVASLDGDPARISVCRPGRRRCGRRRSLSALSDTRSPSSLTPPCSIMRCASVVLGVSPACLRSWPIRIPPSGAFTVTSGMSAGSSPSRKRLSNSSSARFGGFAEWKRVTISLAKRDLHIARMLALSSFYRFRGSKESSSM